MQESAKYWKSSLGEGNVSSYQWKRPLRLIVYYLFLLTMTVAGILYGFYFSERFFASTRPDAIERTMNVLKLFWLVPLPYALLNFYSFNAIPQKSAEE